MTKEELLKSSRDKSQEINNLNQSESDMRKAQSILHEVINQSRDLINVDFNASDIKIRAAFLRSNYSEVKSLIKNQITTISRRLAKLD